MSTHLSRLRRQCQPVQEDTPVAPREHRISVDKRDLLQLLADYDAVCKAHLDDKLASATMQDWRG